MKTLGVSSFVILIPEFLGCLQIFHKSLLKQNIITSHGLIYNRIQNFQWWIVKETHLLFKTH